MFLSLKQLYNSVELNDDVGFWTFYFLIQNELTFTFVVERFLSLVRKIFISVSVFVRHQIMKTIFF
jgi:hypothetical protein